MITGRWLPERSMKLELNCRIAETELEWAGKLNPGKWIEHSRFVALACKNIAAHVKIYLRIRPIALDCFMTSGDMPELLRRSI